MKLQASTLVASSALSKVCNWASAQQWWT